MKEDAGVDAIRPLDNLDLDNIEAAARGESRGMEGSLFTNPADTLRLVKELRQARSSLVTEGKIRELLLRGMESQCELMDGLKQEVRLLRKDMHEIAGMCIDHDCSAHDSLEAIRQVAERNRNEPA